MKIAAKQTDESFEDVVDEILHKIHNPQMGVVLKRMMLRAASKVADEMDMAALVTGEAIGQVSSQTLTNLNVIDSVTDSLLLRPLIAMDKSDIIDTSRKIGTEEFAAAMPEYCGVISVKPTTRAKPEKIEREETRFDFSVLDQAISDARIEKIKNVLANSRGVTEIELVQIPATQDLIVDIRHPQEEELAPLHLTNNEIVKIPFYELNAKLDTLPKDRNILLYCKKGTMSQLHAENLIQEGFELAKVFKP